MQRKPQDIETLADLAQQLVARDRPRRLTGLRGAARAARVAELVRAHGARPVLVVVPDAKAGDALLEDLRAALGEAPDEGRLRAFPRHDTQPYDRFSPQPFVVAQRMDVLYRWLASPAPAAGATTRRAGADRRRAVDRARAARADARGRARRIVHLEVGQIDRPRRARRDAGRPPATRACRSSRSAASWRCAAASSTCSRRSAPRRCAIELLGDEVESIREFDPASQRSQAPLGLRGRAAAARAAARPRARDRALGRDARAAPRSRASRRASVDELLDTLLRGPCRRAPRRWRRCLLPGVETRLRLPAGGHARRDRRARAPGASACCAMPRRRTRTTSSRARADASSRRPTSSRSRRTRSSGAARAQPGAARAARRRAGRRHRALARARRDRTTSCAASSRARAPATPRWRRWSQRDRRWRDER